jgi:cellulose synthase/poly-beta-1,6-N-acetylglucosamine synthase-like glycosyltransferase
MLIQLGLAWWMGMSNQQIRLFAPSSTPKIERHVSMGRHLIEQGIITPWQLFHALDRHHEWDTTLAEILMSKGWITEHQALEALAQYYTAQHVDFKRDPPDQRLSELLSPEFCLKHCIVPWVGLGGLVILATSRPDRFEALRPQLPPSLRGSLIAVASEADIHTHLEQTHRRYLTRAAEKRVPAEESCRTWSNWPRRHWPLLTGLILVVVTTAWVAPMYLYLFLMAWALVTLVVATALKLSALIARWQQGSVGNVPSEAKGIRLPRISVMVPLFHEREIAHALVSRLARLTYPKALLDIVLVLEETDELTHHTLSQATLPNWIRVIEVPAGSGITTKPRALNYALDFCKGDIIGIWDAEDAPAPDQLQKIAVRFAQAPKEVACLQGILDYYNPYTNWLSRCFTIEYATWFRVMLPGVAHLGLAIPLGGTTVFFRRKALEELGGWDSHNVTEDADLGIRLARHGYRTELINTVTQEEANCHFWPWIKQRSRWLKGYMVTYFVHMRKPRLLYQQLGPLKFWGFQVFFLSTLSQFLLAPLIWSFWIVVFGGTHPFQSVSPAFLLNWMGGLFLAVAAIDAIVSIYAISGQNRFRLVPWILTLGLYFPLATIAAYKGLFELIFRPFFWDKTKHGQTDEGKSAQYSGVGV